jgi:cytidine deaminase
MTLTEEQVSRLVSEAVQAQEKAYARYSGYPVGAALQTHSGEIFRGANVENAVYPLTICAERSAVVSAVSSGYQKFDAIAVVTRDGGTPCGSCRQVLAEFGLDIVVVIADNEGKVHQVTTVEDLLPSSFGPQNLDSGG